MIRRPANVAALDSLKIYSPELLQGKVALITGGSNGGLLKEIGKAFLLHGCSHVVFMSRQIEKLQAVAAELDQLTPSGTCIAMQGDVRLYDICEKNVKEIVQRFGRIDILVNGAAGNFLASAGKLSTKGFKTVMEIDTVGTFNMSKAVFVNSMKENKSGNIMNLSAVTHWNGSLLQAHASAGKAGMDALTKVFAVEWGPYGIRVNTLTPGVINGTEGFERLGNPALMNNKAATKQAAASKSSTSLTGGKQASLTTSIPIPMLRFGEPQDCANAALYLASPAAAYVTGWNLAVDGGMWLTMPNMMFTLPQIVQPWAQAKL